MVLSKGVGNQILGLREGIRVAIVFLVCYFISSVSMGDLELGLGSL